jgi:hypothetical protein
MYTKQKLSLIQEIPFWSSFSLHVSTKKLWMGMNNFDHFVDAIPCESGKYVNLVQNTHTQLKHLQDVLVSRICATALGDHAPVGGDEGEQELGMPERAG